MKILSLKALRWLPVLFILVFWACRVSDTEGDQYLVWHLNASLADYDTVSIKLVDAQDTTLVYEQIWNAKLPDPEHFPKHKLEAARDKDFTIQIRAYNDKHELVWAKNIEVAGGHPKDPILLTADLRLFQIKAPPLDLSPGFNPNVFDYTAHVGDSIDAFSLSASPMDSSNSLMVDGKALDWGKAVPEALAGKDNTFELKVKGKDDEVRVYHLTVTRGDGITPEEGDKPVLNMGPNQAVRKGDEVTFPVSVTVKKGAIASFKYDLEGDGTWDNTDTATLPATLKHTYAENKVYTARFQARSTLGPVDSITCTINVTDARYLLAIVSPSRDTLVTKSPFPVRYTVNGTALVRNVDLSDGDNVVKVDTGDGEDKVSASVKITLDSVPPKAPNLSTTTPTTNLRPQWTWTGGGGGNGRFRMRLDSSDLSGTAETPATQFVPGADLKLGDHTLFVSERDEAGNWSPAADFKVTIVTDDNTAPNAPKVSGASPTNSAPKWTWTTGGGGGDGNFRYKVNDSTLATGATATTDTALTYAGSLSNGATYTLYVQEKDAAGNWSASGSRAIVYDASKPSVTIVAPLSSGTYLTKEAAVGLSGKASGPQAISKVTYKVNGGAALDASLSGDSWSISALTLTEGAALVVTVTATDAAGNNAEASVSLLKDATAPTVPAFTSEPATPTASPRGSWAWKAGSDGTGGSGLSGKYRYSQDGGKTWTETSASLVNDLTLAEGNNALDLQEQDLAGNWSLSATSVVKSDRSGPKLAVTGPASPISLKTIHLTLSGTATDDGTSVQSVTITGQKSGSGAAVLTGNAWTSAALTLDTGTVSLIVTATDLLGNASKDTVAISVKVPVAVVAITTPAANFLTNKDTVTVKYTIDGGAETAKAFNLTVEGNNVLTITGPANEAGVTGSASVTVIRDKTAPVVAITSPAAGSITNQTSVTISYTEKDGAAAAVAKTQIVNLAKDSGVVNTFTINSTADAAGNIGSATISLYKRSYVTFFKPAGTGLANGTSWANAYGGAQLQTILNIVPSHAEIWLAAGSYLSLDTTEGIRLHSDISLYGSFPAAGTAKAITDRTFAAADTSVFSGAKGTAVITVPGVQHAGMDSVILDGFKFLVGPNQIGYEPDWTFAAIVRNVNFHATSATSAPGLSAGQTDLTMENCKFSGFTAGPDRILFATGRSSGAGGSSFKMTNCDFSGNTWVPGSNTAEVFLLYPDDNLAIVNSTFMDHVGSGQVYVELSDGNITVTGSTFLSTTSLLVSVSAPSSGSRTDGGGNHFLNQP